LKQGVDLRQYARQIEQDLMTAEDESVQQCTVLFLISFFFGFHFS
jgi:hypothetical protein